MDHDHHSHHVHHHEAHCHPQPQGSHSHGTHDKHAGHDPAMFRRKFWLSLALTIPTLAFSHTVQEWFGVSWTFPGSQYIPAILGVIIFLYGGLVFLKSARAELAAKQPGMMTLISMAITVAFLYSLAVTVGLTNGMDFWWELATLVTIMLLGHWLEMASVQRAQGALGELAKLLPSEAELADGTVVAVASLKVGDVVLVRPGARVPADGVVVKGTSAVDESMLTGESAPVQKEVDSVVIGGTSNGTGSLTVRVTKVGSDTVLSGIMKLVADAQASKSRTQVIADKAAFYLTFIALGAAVVAAVVWTACGSSLDTTLERVVTVLVVACPHALGLAIPLVTAISTTLAARHGILVRQQIALEAARTIDAVVFDKTGTLTTGQQGVVQVAAAAGSVSDVVRWAASVERESEHSIAEAIVAEAARRKLRLAEVHDFAALGGRGARATVEGHAVYVGGPRLLQELDLQPDDMLAAARDTANAAGQTIVYVVRDKQVVGALALADTIRPESYEAVQSLQQMGVRVLLLTGDSQAVAAWVAGELGIADYTAEVLPELKADTVARLQADGSRVAMVGDGVNDAPALARADVGVAIGAGTDVAIESADIVLASSDPRGVARSIRLSRAAYRKMVQNLAWATGYNAIAIPLAAGVLAPVGFVLDPAVGAVLMSLSTIVVALNAQLLRRTKL